MKLSPPGLQLGRNPIIIHLSISIFLSLFLSLSVVAMVVLNKAKKKNHYHLSVHVSFYFHVRLIPSFFLPFLHIPTAWIETEIPFIRPSISFFFSPTTISPSFPDPTFSVSLPRPPVRRLKAKSSIRLHTHPSFPSISCSSLKVSRMR